MPQRKQDYDMSCAMNQAVEKIRKKVVKKSNVYNVDLLFTSKTVPELKVQLFRSLDRIVIDQDFNNNYTDKIIADLTLDLEPFLALYYFRKDLDCKVRFTTVNPLVNDSTAGCKGRQAAEEFTLKFKAVVLTYDDVFKKVDYKRIYPQYSDERNEHDRDRATYKMKVEFISPDIFFARKKQMNIICRGVVMAEMMEAAATFFKIPIEQFTVPDNQFKYTNFIVPSLGIEEIMSYYQNAPGLGVYYNGFSNYITRYWKVMNKNCWYVYPKYGCIRKDNPIHIYHVGGNIYHGALCWHYKCPAAGINILTTGPLNITNWSDVGTENATTGYNVQISEMLLDGSRRLIADDNWKIRPQNSRFGDLATDPLDSKNVIKIDRIQSKGNLFKIKSDLRAPQGSSVNITWNNAEPFVFTPNTAVYLYYDHALGFRKVTCTAEHIVYDIVRDKSRPVNPMFICTATVGLNMDNIQGGWFGGTKSHV